MKLSKKGIYAVEALINLSNNQGTEGSERDRAIKLDSISYDTNISQQYLEQLFRKLRVAEIVKSVKGPNGGYILNKPKDKITIKDVFKAVGEPIELGNDTFTGLKGIVNNYLNTETIESLT